MDFPINKKKDIYNKNKINLYSFLLFLIIIKIKIYNQKYIFFYNLNIILKELIEKKNKNFLSTVN
jgi:hypothetical protein